MSTLQQFRLAGRVAVVTGASSGIGRASASVLAEAGADVVLADVDAANLDAAREEVARAGTRVITAQTDVTDKAQVDVLAARAKDELGRLDVWANVAGIIVTANVVDMTEAELDRIMAVNLKGTFFGCQAAMAAMRGGGSIINMASSAIDQPAPGIAGYAMTKAAVTMLTRTAALEGGHDGIRVNAIAPGYIVTPMTQRHGDERSAAVAEIMRKASPLGTVGQPEDVANAVLFLASDASRFVTGQILRPNGGTTMPW